MTGRRREEPGYQDITVSFRVAYLLISCNEIRALTKISARGRKDGSIILSTLVDALRTIFYYMYHVKPTKPDEATSMLLSTEAMKLNTLQ